MQVDPCLASKQSLLFAVCGLWQEAAAAKRLSELCQIPRAGGGLSFGVTQMVLVVTACLFVCFDSDSFVASMRLKELWKNPMIVSWNRSVSSRVRQVLDQHTFIGCK